MKVKLNFDKDAIMGFLAHQSEKIVLGLVALCFLMFVYRAIGRERYDKRPEDLITAANKADEKLEATGPPAVSNGSHFEKWVVSNNGAIEVKPYRYATVWNKSLFEQRRPRGEPKLYTVEGLRGAAGVGAVTVRGESGGGAGPSMGRGGRDRRGLRWVVLTGLVPAMEQAKAYDECFKDAMKPTGRSEGERDVPRYAYYQIQRAKVDPRADSVGQWESLNLRAALKEAEELWGSVGGGREVVSREYVEVSELVFPLPPLIDQEWDASVAHEPDIPLVTRDLPTDRQREARGSAAPAERSNVPIEDRPPSDDSRTGRGMDRRTLESIRSGRRPGEFGVAPGSLGGRAGAEEVPYQLFRFFDFNVEPGASYRYRVRLWLKNPNQGLEPRMIQSPALAKEENIMTDWTEPTGAISMPRDDRLLVASVTPSRGPTGEPSTKILAVHWDVDLGIEVHEEFSIWRGTLANFLDRKTDMIPPPSTLGRLDVGRTPGRRDTEEQAKVNYRTETLVLDIRGGEQLPGRDRKQTSPGEVLLLAPDGSLVVQGELEDMAEVKHRQELAEKITPATGPKKASGKAGGRQDDFERLLRPGVGIPGPGKPPKKAVRPR